MHGRLRVRHGGVHTVTVRGSCLCGAVRWEADGPFEFLSHCYCGRCRKAHSAAFATYVMSPAGGFRLTGREHVRTFRTSPTGERPFCLHCGSVVADGAEWQGLVQMPAGALDDDPGVRPVAHILVGSKAPWWEIRDAVPQFDGYPPGIDMAVLGDLPPADPPSGKPRGSCLCGDVAYVVEGTPSHVVLCHCSRCRKINGAAHNAMLWTTGEPVRFTRGEASLVTYAVAGTLFRQRFCPRCGAKMPAYSEEFGFSFVPMGTLDDDPGIRPSGHLYVGSKAPWYELPDDGLPRHETLPGMG